MIGQVFSIPGDATPEERAEIVKEIEQYLNSILNRK